MIAIAVEIVLVLEFKQQNGSSHPSAPPTPPSSAYTPASTTLELLKGKGERERETAEASPPPFWLCSLDSRGGGRGARIGAKIKTHPGGRPGAPWTRSPGTGWPAWLPCGPCLSTGTAVAKAAAARASLTPAPSTVCRAILLQPRPGYPCCLTRDSRPRASWYENNRLFCSRSLRVGSVGRTQPGGLSLLRAARASAMNAGPAGCWTHLEAPSHQVWPCSGVARGWLSWNCQPVCLPVPTRVPTCGLLVPLKPPHSMVAQGS